ncbi:ornithine carbamoyltransferase [Streptomyces tanashiensis]
MVSPVESLNAIRGAEIVRQHHEVPATPDPVDAGVHDAVAVDQCGSARSGLAVAIRACFKVTKELMHRFSGSSEAVFMHDLPAVRDQEVTSDVLDGNSVTSLVQRQAYHKASAAAAALLWTSGVSS